jgi:hypothetical protein
MNTKATKTSHQQSPVTDWLTPKVYKPPAPRRLTPRFPTRQEQNELIDYVMKQDNLPEDQRAHVASLFFGGDSPVAIFDHYRTYYPTFIEKLLVVISDLDPNNTSCFIWKRNGEI